MIPTAADTVAGRARLYPSNNFYYEVHIKGLGLKFLKISKVDSNRNLILSLGYADPVNFFIDTNRYTFFFKDIRNILLYSTDYCFLRNQVFTLLGLKKPNKFRKRENGIAINSQIL